MELTLAGFERRRIAQGHLGDGLQRLVGEERLVAGDQHVGEAQQAGEDVVGEDLL